MEKGSLGAGLGLVTEEVEIRGMVLGFEFWAGRRGKDKQKDERTHRNGC